ncbi:hypothetical protein GOODEAATRI_004055, partial [Goodea atripinnis]
VCGKCGEALSRTQPAVRAMDKLFHSNCFCCMSCHRPLQGMQFYDRDGSPQSPGSEETVRVVALDKNFHLKCYRCEDCARPLSIEADENGCYPLDGKILCMKCHTKRAKQAAQ